MLLVVIAIVLAIEMKGLLIGESATLTDQQKIAAAIEIEPSVQRLIHMRTEHIGPDELLVGAKIELVEGLSMAEIVEVVNRVETSVRRAVPMARIMYLEPDVFRTHVPSDSTAPAHLLTAGRHSGDEPEHDGAGESGRPEASEPAADAGGEPAPAPRQG